jgi:hypothetical protein
VTGDSNPVGRAGQDRDAPLTTPHPPQKLLTDSEGKAKRTEKKNGGNEPNPGTLYEYVENSQETSWPGTVD